MASQTGLRTCTARSCALVRRWGGGNILFTEAPTNPIDGMQLLPPEQRGKAIGVQERPLGPARFEFVTGEDFYKAALDGEPYRARALVNFGANLMMAHG